MNLRNLAIFILLVAGGLMAFLIYDLNSTEKTLAHSLTQKPMQNVTIELDRFFSPVEDALLTTRDHAEFGGFDIIASGKMNSYFVPLVKNFPQISSMGLANTEGFEYDVLPDGDQWENRLVWIDSLGMVEKWSKWKEDTLSRTWINIEKWEDKVKNDPRERPWFKDALEQNEGNISWTDPYIYNTTQEAGITASVRWERPNDPRKFIMAFDLTLSDITAFTKEIKVSQHGKVFVLSDKGQYIGLPNDKLFNSEDAIKNTMLKDVDSVNIPVIRDAYDHWISEHEENDVSFEFMSEDNYWWGKLVKHHLSPSHFLIIGVVIPEKDILSDVQRSKRIIIGSFIFVLILTGFVLYSYGQSRIANVALANKNIEITEQKHIIEEKNKDILDSIHYAKRLQEAILPSMNLFKENLPQSFILYKPKDIVAGDFYWMEKLEDQSVFFAAADCTGHGVPGAMVSVVCANALFKALIEEHKTKPSDLLDRTRELVIDSFGRSEEEIKDGMDISLCCLKSSDEGYQLQWAGANNPLWIIRKGNDEVEEIKADKQPIGKYADELPFTNHTVQLNQGDTIYIFSDGYPDQFGGDKGKKYKSGKLKKYLLSIQDMDMYEQQKSLEEEFEKWKDDFEQVDDVCVIGVRV